MARTERRAGGAGRTDPSRDGRRSGTRRGRAGYEARTALDRASAALQWMRDHRTFSTFVIIVGILLLALFGPVRSRYTALRTGDVLRLKVERLKASNAQIEEERNRLLSEEGVEEAARGLGYVSQQEAEGDSPSASDGADAPAPTTNSDVVAVEEPYTDDRSAPTKVFDVLFGFDPEATWNNA